MYIPSSDYAEAAPHGSAWRWMHGCMGSFAIVVVACRWGRRRRVADMEMQGQRATWVGKVLPNLPSARA